MIVIGPYRAFVININDLKSATEGRPCIHTRDDHNERETHFPFLPANLVCLKIFFALSCALFALDLRIWRDLACVKSSKSMAEAVPFIDFYDLQQISDCSWGRQKSKYESHLTKIEVRQRP